MLNLPSSNEPEPVDNWTARDWDGNSWDIQSRVSKVQWSGKKKKEEGTAQLSSQDVLNFVGGNIQNSPDVPQDF